MSTHIRWELVRKGRPVEWFDTHAEARAALDKHIRQGGRGHILTVNTNVEVEQ